MSPGYVAKEREQLVKHFHALIKHKETQFIESFEEWQDEVIEGSPPPQRMPPPPPLHGKSPDSGTNLTRWLGVSTNSANRLPAPPNLVRLCQHLAVPTGGGTPADLLGPVLPQSPPRSFAAQTPELAVSTTYTAIRLPAPPNSACLYQQIAVLARGTTPADPPQPHPWKSQGHAGARTGREHPFSTSSVTASACF